MTLARTRRNPAEHRGRPEETADDVYDAMPTTLYDRDDRTSGVLRAAPRDLRWTPPSAARANAPTLAAVPWRMRQPSPLATFSLPSAGTSPSFDEAPRISQMLRELPAVPKFDASRPLICAPNPFLTPPDPMATPPMWSLVRKARTTGKAQARPRRRRSILPFVAAAFGAAIGIGLWHDEGAREEVLSALDRTADRIGAFVVEAAIR